MNARSGGCVYNVSEIVQKETSNRYLQRDKFSIMHKNAKNLCKNVAEKNLTQKQ